MGAEEEGNGRREDYEKCSQTAQYKHKLHYKSNREIRKGIGKRAVQATQE